MRDIEDAVCALPDGLTDEEVERSRAEHGSNAIPEPEPITFWNAFKESFGDPMIRILLVIAALMIVMFFFGLAEIYEPVGTIVAVLLVAFFSAKTSVASDVKYIELKESSRSETCKARRGGSICVVDVDDVVVGDLIMLGPGDKIPADGVLVSGELRVNNAALNGEVEECIKRAAHLGTELPAEITGEALTDDRSLFRGAVVFDGDGALDVKRVGIETMMGRMAADMQEAEPDSPLKQKLSRLAHHISIFGYVGASVITLLYIGYFAALAGGPVAYLAQGASAIVGDVVRAVSLGIVIVVCAVPEGLPLMISLVLMQNTSRMLDHNVLVRTAIGIETSGSLNILFSDKTGTITKGMLEVAEMLTADGAAIERGAGGELEQLVQIAVAKNTQAMFDREGRAIGGNATDRALVDHIGAERFRAAEQDPELCASAHQAFNSANKFSQAFIASSGRTFYKGAPERLLARASRYVAADGSVRELDVRALDAKIDELARRAMRVIALGYSESPMQQDSINDDVVIIGLAAIRDDVRPEAREAIEEVRSAGIQVVMITGDRLETAMAIGRDAGLVEDDGDVVLSSAQLAEMSDDELKSIMPKIRVIARALPTDKSRMVRICQEMGLVVGMTGDGVNDSPALKRADVGFAMGSGTEAAKEAGEIIILDDNFKSIKDAIWYGRTIYHNILKFCRFQLVINAAAVLVSALAPFCGIDEPLKVTHLLFVNLVMDSLGALMLGSEPALARYMQERPRRRDEALVSRRMMQQILITGAWLTAASFAFLKLPFFRGLFASDAEHLTGFFVFFILISLFNGFNVRDESPRIFAGLDKNRSFLKIMASIIIVQALIVNAALVPLPFFQWIGSMCSCVPFGAAGWFAAAALALTVIPMDMLRKALSTKGAAAQ